MAELRVILVEPLYEGNVGQVARSMMNLGAPELAIVKGVALADEARERAVHAQTVLDSARRCDTLEAAARGCDQLVGFTARITGLERKYRRNPVDVRDWAAVAAAQPGRIGLVFGREDHGLSNEETDRCDILVAIPTEEAYRSLNLAHAVTIALWSVYAEKRVAKVKEYTPAAIEDVDRLHEKFGRLLEEGGYPAHKLEATKTMFRRMIGRGAPTTWEAATLMGVFKRLMWALGVRRTRGPMELPPEERGDLGAFPTHMEDDAMAAQDQAMLKER